MPVIQIPVVIGEHYTVTLKRRMEELDISQGELSRQSGIPESSLSRMFNEQLAPQLKNATRIEVAIVEIMQDRKKTKRRKRGKSD